MSHCRTCGAEVEWAITEPDGRAIPLDKYPSAAGNLLAVEETSAGTKVVRAVPQGNPGARVAHLATCPKPKRNPR